MAFFIPLIAAMAGNVGIQSSAIIVQGIASNSLGLESTFSKLVKELLVSLLNGLILSGLLFLYNYFYQREPGAHIYGEFITVCGDYFCSPLWNPDPPVAEQDED